jgi:hypothetical protein
MLWWLRWQRQLEDLLLNQLEPCGTDQNLSQQIDNIVQHLRGLDSLTLPTKFSTMLSSDPRIATRRKTLISQSFFMPWNTNHKPYY